MTSPLQGSAEALRDLAKRAMKDVSGWNPASPAWDSEYEREWAEEARRLLPHLEAAFTLGLEQGRSEQAERDAQIAETHSCLRSDGSMNWDDDCIGKIAAAIRSSLQQEAP